MKDFGTAKKPETGTDDPASKYRKTVKFVSRRPNSSEKDEAVIRLVGGIKLAGMFWFQSPNGKRFAINTPFFDEDDETFISGKCPIFDRGLTNPSTVWAMNAINRYLQRDEHNPNPIEVFPANKTEFGALMDLHHEHGAPNAIKRGYDIITRKWKSKGKPQCSITVKTSMDGSSFTPLSEIEQAYTHYDLDLLYQPKAIGEYILDVIKAALLSKEIGGEGLYTPDDFKRDYDKYMPKDEQPKRAKARQGILKRFGELYDGVETGEEQTDGRAPAMMGGGDVGTAPAPAPGPAPMPHNAMPANAVPDTQEPATPPAPAEPAPVPPATQQTAPVDPAPTPPPTAVTAAPSAPPAAGTQVSAAPPATPAPPPASAAPTPAPTPPPTANAPAAPPMAPPPSSGKLNIPAAVNPAAPPPGMPDPGALMSTLAPGALGSIDDDDDEL